MNRARDQLLPGAALPDHQYRRVGERHSRRCLVDLQHPFAAADHVLQRVLLADLALEPPVLRRQPAMAQRPIDHQLDRVHVVRLGDVVVGAAADGVDRAVDVAEGGHQQHRRFGRVLVDPVEHFEPVDVDHADVGDDRVELAVLFQLADRFRAVRHRDHAMSVLGEDLLHQRARGRIVVDHQNARGFRHLQEKITEPALKTTAVCRL